MELNFDAIKRLNIWRENSLVSFLQKVPLFEDMDALVIESFISECSVLDYPANDTVLTEWSESNGEAYVIISGTADVLIGGEKASQLSEGDIFGEYALVCDEKRGATVYSTSPLKCLVFTEASILRLSDETSNLNNILVQRINENTQAKRWLSEGRQ